MTPIDEYTRTYKEIRLNYGAHLNYGARDRIDAAYLTGLANIYSAVTYPQ